MGIVERKNHQHGWELNHMLHEVKLSRYLIVPCSCLKGRYKGDGINLFLAVYSAVRIATHNVWHWIFGLDIRKSCSTWRAEQHWRSRFSSTDPCFQKRVGQSAGWPEWVSSRRCMGWLPGLFESTLLQFSNSVSIFTFWQGSNPENPAYSLDLAPDLHNVL